MSNHKRTFVIEMLWNPFDQNYAAKYRDIKLLLWHPEACVLSKIASSIRTKLNRNQQVLTCRNYLLNNKNLEFGTQEIPEQLLFMLELRTIFHLPAELVTYTQGVAYSNILSNFEQYWPLIYPDVKLFIARKPVFTRERFPYASKHSVCSTHHAKLTKYWFSTSTRLKT